ncbi:hypothetical protein [Romboutsia sp. Marseille-P6047]|uniref:hypothetical protein n=1 Tax=Romboutsia sp. Marseille-P6047 TaxID=2161817 RepID=UPI0008217984|nr:hypothetical protein [Romboutsia sp. Marseille-P6047]SCH75575.1 Uncharacterised protein [uncultured Clostridium sp.]
MKNSKDELKDAFAQLQSAQSCLNHALKTVEKQNNKHQIENTITYVKEAVFAASNALANYQD